MLGLLVWMALVAMEDPPPERCEVKVTGMPVSVMSHHRLAIGNDRERPLQERMELRLDGSATRLVVVGPRYSGQRKLEAGECRDGAVFDLRVQPRPATIEFPCAPERMTVACESCPGTPGEGVHMASQFPPIPMTSFSLEIDVVLRAPGFRRKTQRLRLHPGPNRVQVQLNPLAR